ncbi:MAG: hypothetical protein E2O82_05105 [Betaproteobacteria bacterium]|nr:MAG: hypothetical protein E2O82_05105 [Betaproteobacteria bacterium]
MNLKQAQPFAVGSLLVFALGLGGQALWSANAVENLALANEKDILHEKEMRVVGAAVLEQDIGELKADVKELQKEMKAETGDIKRLLNQLLLQGTGTVSPVIH